MTKKQKLTDAFKQMQEPEQPVRKGNAKRKKIESVNDESAAPEQIETPAMPATVEESGTQLPRGQRADFLKVTITLPGDMLTKLRTLGVQRKADKKKDADVSSLIREAVADFLNKHKTD